MIVRVWVATDSVRSKVSRRISIDDDEWANMSPVERDEYLYEEVTNMIQWGWEKE